MVLGVGSAQRAGNPSLTEGKAKTASVSVGTSRGCLDVLHSISSECWEVRPVIMHWTQEPGSCPRVSSGSEEKGELSAEPGISPAYDSLQSWVDSRTLSALQFSTAPQSQTLVQRQVKMPIRKQSFFLRPFAPMTSS